MQIPNPRARVHVHVVPILTKPFNKDSAVSFSCVFFIVIRRNNLQTPKIAVEDRGVNARKRSNLVSHYPPWVKNFSFQSSSFVRHLILKYPFQ